MAVMCREFGISRKTGYKIFNRYKDFGIRGLEDRARSPYRHPNKTPFQIEKAILRIKRGHRSWGAPKIRDKLIKEFPGIKPPAASTVHAILDRHGLVKRRKRKRYKAQGTDLSHAQVPNGLWCADYKGHFMLGNRKVLLSADDYRLSDPVTCSPVRVLSQSRKPVHSLYLNGFSRTMVCQLLSAPITVYRLLHPMRCLASVGFQCGGCDWVLALNVSSQAILNRMVGTNECT